jgi:hypothetical protein
MKAKSSMPKPIHPLSNNSSSSNINNKNSSISRTSSGAATKEDPPSPSVGTVTGKPSQSFGKKQGTKWTQEEVSLLFVRFIPELCKYCADSENLFPE